MRAVNLLPREALQEGGSLPKWLPMFGAAAVPVIALNLVLIGYSHAHSAAKAQIGQLIALQAEVARSAPAVAAAGPDTSLLVIARTQRTAALTDVLTKQVAWDKALGDVARVLPRSAWLTDMTVMSPTPADTAAPVATPGAVAPATTGTGTGFTASGYAYSQDDVALLLQRLQLLPTLSGVTLVSTAQSLIGKKPVIQFSITAGVVAQ